MKLYEVARSKLTAEEKENRWYYIEKETDIPKKYVKLTPEGNYLVDLTQSKGNFTIGTGDYSRWHDSLRFKFDKIALGGKRLRVQGAKLKNLVGLPEDSLDGSLTITSSSLESFLGCPKEIHDKFAFWMDYGESKLTSWEHAPHTVGTLSVKAPSLIGINDHIKRVTTGIVIIETQPNCIDSSPFYKEGGLGLILIPGVKEIRGTFSNTAEILEGPFAIISKYAGKPDDIFKCQQELIEAGFEEYAQL